MLLGHTPISVTTSAVPGFNPSIVLPDQSHLSYTSPSPLTANIHPLYRNPFALAGMDANTLALTTAPVSVVPSNTTAQPPVPSLADRCFDAFYHFFHASHPFVLPREHFLRMFKEGISPNMNIVMAAMRYIGALFVDAGPAKANYLDEALRLCYQPSTQKDGFLIQALLLLIIGLDGETNRDKSRELLADCELYAIEIDLNKRQFASLHGRGNPVLEESWRRTWWDLFVVDGMIAGVHRVTNFLLYTVETDVALPCEEHEYLSGVRTFFRVQSSNKPTNFLPKQIPRHPLSLEDFEDQTFSGEDREFSSFAYRIAAARNLGYMMHNMPQAPFPDDSRIPHIESLLTNWRLHLPESKRDDLGKHCQLDEMMFQAHFITHA